MAASASASASTSADSNINYCYDVFINHRGPDVKKTFASHLYRRLLSHGLKAFLDQEELQAGRNFDSQIKEAIRTASVHIAIFSPKYAKSEWCLKELVLMLESGAPIIPVFHQVKPAEVRWTQGEGIYARALQKLEEKRTRDSQPRYDTSTIEKWRNTLSRVADISGLDLEAFNRDEGELIDKVVEVVLKKLSGKIQLNVAKYPTGLDEKVSEFEMSVLSQQHNGRVGITGLGGVGKTTLAKELFNRKNLNYSKSCFLVDVRENAKNSLHSLQRKLVKGLFQLDNLHIDNCHEGIEIIRKHLSSSQVFIVLDDVDHVDQVDALLPLDVLQHDSLILITSRHKDVLARSGVQESSIYKLSGLNTEHSRELFCSHAFCQPHPLCGFENVVEEFVSACHGLPLCLKVVGALLSGNKDQSYWEGHLDRLQKTLPDDIQKSLRISYDALQKEEQHIFLDIALFFIGQNKGTAITIWNASGWNGSLGFQTLLDKCLVELDTEAFNSRGMKIENCIRMHDHLRDLGRDLAKHSGLTWRDVAKQAGLPSRLWRGTKNIDYLLQQSYHEAAADVRGIRMRSKTPNHMDASSSDDDDDDESASFSRFKMEKLQLLDIDIEADRLECILRVVHLPNLLWLRWRGCTSLPPWIPLKKLRVLEVEGYRLKTLWQDLQAPLQLRELRVECSCGSCIPKSIGQLKHLERIVLCTRWWSGSIFEIPEEFCHLRSLKHLQFRYLRTRSLPDSFGNLRNLEYIDLTDCTELKRLPNSFGSLSKLKYLDLSRCFHLTLSSGSFGNITTLEYINLTDCDSIEVLPSQIAHQPSLEKLDLDLPNLKEWPSATGEPSGLEKFVLKSPLLETLPSSFGLGLWNLKHLELRGCRSLKRLPDSVRLLNQLTELTAEDCSLRELHFKTFEGESETPSTESTGKGRSSSLGTSFSQCLLGLQHLKLHHTEISEVSFPTSVCPNLQHLDIRDCNDLVEVGTLPKALITLTLENCSKLRKIEGLRGLAKLQRLNIGGSKILEFIESVEST